MHFQYIQPVTSIESLKTSRSAVVLARGYTRGAQISCKCRNQLKIPGARRVTWTRLRTQNLQMLGATIPSSVTQASWRTVLVHPRCLSWELVKCVTSYFTLPHCSHLDTQQVCGKFIAVQQKPPLTVHHSIWTLHCVVCVWLFLYASF
jgi:hypothetical protein